MIASQFNKNQKEQHNYFLLMSQSTYRKVSKIPPSILSRPSTAILAKSKYNQDTKIFT